MKHSICFFNLTDYVLYQSSVSFAAELCKGVGRYSKATESLKQFCYTTFISDNYIKNYCRNTLSTRFSTKFEI